MHPLTAAAQCKLQSAKAPHHLLTLDWLTEWTARKVSLPFYRIDPLKIDFTSVSDVMSAKYATRFNILPVETTGNTVVSRRPILSITNGKKKSAVYHAKKYAWFLPILWRFPNTSSSFFP